MGGRDDFDRAFKAVMAARRKELGEPTAEELLDYRDGRLDPAARQSLEERLAIDPDAARALADLAAFPEVEPAPGVAEFKDDEVERRWQILHEKLKELPQQPAMALVAAPAPAASSPSAPTPIEPLHPRRSGWIPALRLAAAAVLALAAGWIGFLSGRASRPSPVNVAVALVELAPLEEGRARSLPPVEVPGAPEEVVLVLGLPAASELPEYRVEIVDEQGALLWSGGGLHPTPLGTVDLSIRRSALPAGTSRIRLFDADRGSRLAVYELRLAESPGSS
jgi:anti-sigma factor RsiW